MKNLILLVFLLGFIPILVSSQRPIEIDHGSYFEEPSNYFTDRQSLVSALMTLKASIWNAELGRDPDLAKNRFNGEYVWSKVCDPETGEVHSVAEVAEVMKEQGALTFLAMEEFNNYTKQPKLSHKEEEEAFMYKTKALFTLKVGEDSGDRLARRILLNQLKDSLIRGRDFVMSFPLYEDFWGRNRALYQYVNEESHYVDYQLSHGVIVGYNDAIKTQKGYGAFLMHFNDKSQPLVYYDYEWLLSYPGFNFSCYFLQENFRDMPEVALHMSVSNSLDNLRENYGVYPFTDTLVSKSSTLYDYSDFFGDYSLYKGIARVSEVDGKKLPQKMKRILIPANNGTGNYDVISDLTSVASADFNEIKVSVLDLVKGEYNYYIPGVHVGYFYEKPEAAEIEGAYISILGSGEKILGTVESLPDTVINLEGFKSYVVDYFGQIPRPELEVNSCSFTLRRKVITFSSSNKTSNRAPVFTSYEAKGITARLGENVELEFKAVDPDGDNITYSIESSSNSFQINNQGLVTFNPSSLGNHFATVVASDGKYAVMKDIQILVLESNNKKPRFVNYMLYESYWAQVNMYFKINFAIRDDDAGLDLPSYQLVEKPSAISSYYLDPYTGMFQFFRTEREDWYYFTVMASSQGDTLYHDFVIKLGDPVVDPVITSDEITIDFKAYPNPVFDELCLEVENENGELDISILDASGRLLNNSREYCVAGPNHFYINTSNFKTGMYFVRLILNEKNKTIRIIKK